MQNSFNKYIEQTIRKHWDLPALTDFQGTTYHYKDVARRMAQNTYHARSRRYKAWR